VRHHFDLAWAQLAQYAALLRRVEPNAAWTVDDIRADGGTTSTRRRPRDRRPRKAPRSWRP
jgi:hypothetical protein